MFRTELPIAPASALLPRTARVLTVGSCFADSIGARLTHNKVNALVNPFGTVFQPLALGRLLRAAAGEDVDWQQHLVEARGRWQSYDLHGSIGADSPVALLQAIQELVRRTGEFLRTADVVLLTLGTAWAHRLRETGELVSNCHKQPADLFVRELLTPDDIINGLAETHAYLRRINPALRFVLTVSPVRHLRDTLPLNAVSKSVLRVATHFVSELLPDVAYFPAYELLLDDLRDYRFYAADMLHLSEVAEDYIWDKFVRTYFNADFGRFRQEWAGVRQALAHRPLHDGAPEHREFLVGTLDKLEQLGLRKVDVEGELREVRTRLAALPAATRPAPAPAVEDDEERIDIGDAATEAFSETRPAPTLVELPPVAEGRPPRLSPEEFRVQRAAGAGQAGRGRRGGRGPRPGEETAATGDSERLNAQIQATAAFTGKPLDTPASRADLGSPVVAAAAAAAAKKVLRQAIPTPDAAPPEVDAGAANTLESEPGKKKKRRSRGGAKRTARKNALRLTDLPSAGAEAAEPLAADLGAADLPGAEATPDTVDGGRPTGNAPASRSSRSRNSRRKGRNADPAAANADSSDGSGVASAVAETLPGADSPPAELADSGNSAQLTRPQAVAQTGKDAIPTRQPAASLSTAAAILTPDSAPIADSIRKPSRAKARAASGARAEKPAVDTPIIPVVTDARRRTQVAAGRMTGSSATLVVPVAPAAKVVAKVAAVKKSAVAKVKPVAAVPASAAVSPPALPAPVARPRAATPPKPAAKPKPAAHKDKAAPPAQPAVVKPKAPKPAAKKPAAKPAPPVSKAPTPVAPKPKASRKPTKVKSA